MLMQCANDSSQVHSLEMLHSPSIKPSKVIIGIVSYATDDIWDYSVYSLAVNQAYAEHNGYIMRMLHSNTSNYDPNDARWNKVKILEQALHPDTGWARDVDYLMWVDADLIFLDMNMRLEKVVAQYPRSHMLVSAEHAGSSTLINSGAILVRNSNWSRSFLSDWWSHADRTLHSDQEQFDLLYHQQKHSRELERYITILPPDAINSDPPAMTKQRPYNQILHLMGEHSVFRIRVFKSAFTEICEQYNYQQQQEKEKEKVNISHRVDTRRNRVLSRQLGVTREVLLQWSLAEYSLESKVLMKHFQELVGQGLNGLSQCKRVSNSVHHYAHALEHSSDDRDKQLAEKLRVQVFELLLTNLQMKREENRRVKEETGRMLGDWPELIKTVAEAGQHLLQFGDTIRRNNVATTIMELLTELYHSCHRVQKKAVLAMIAHMHSEIGLIALSESDVNKAVKHFQKSVDISEELADISGTHMLVNPMSYLANALSMQGKFSKSIPIFEKIINISEKHLGVNHESLAQLLVNYGIALFESGRLNDAEKTLKRSVKIMVTNKFSSEELLFKRAHEYIAKAQEREL